MFFGREFFLGEGGIFFWERGSFCFFWESFVFLVEFCFFGRALFFLGEFCFFGGVLFWRVVFLEFFLFFFCLFFLCF